MTEQMIHLQAIGLVRARPAAEIEADDIVQFNYGHTYTVKRIQKETEKTITLILVNQAGDEFTKRFGKNTLVACSRT